jgi:hypothetical protein
VEFRYPGDVCEPSLSKAEEALLLAKEIVDRISKEKEFAEQESW